MDAAARLDVIAAAGKTGAAVATGAGCRSGTCDISTCAIGALERGGVLSSDFKVHGTEGLRVVDASVFPRIPGLFIASAIFMIGEKAAEVIIADAKRTV